MPLSPCEKCGGALRRTRRTFVERLFYSEAYECSKCNHRTRTRNSSIPSLKHVHYVKCPRCHNVDLTPLKRRDGVDRMQGGPVNLIHRFLGGKLYHCWFCRIQFYDRRQPFHKSRPNRRLLPPPDDPEASFRLASY